MVSQVLGQQPEATDGIMVTLCLASLEPSDHHPPSSLSVPRSEKVS